MTAGPASRIVTLLPRNRPTPMAPPMAIMVSCLWLRQRCPPSPSGAESFPPAKACSSVMTAHAGRFKHQQMDVLLKDLGERVHVVHGVVYVERYPQAVMPVRCHDVALSQLLHQQIG